MSKGFPCMPKTSSLILALLLAAPVTSYAAESPCPPVPSKPRPPRKPRPRPPAKPPEAPKACNCAPGKDGQPGVPGRAGRDGLDGKNGTVTVTRWTKTPAQGASLRIGLTGILYAPHGDWAWGPALQLSQPVGSNGEFVIDAGLARGADGWVGNEHGLLLHAGYARYLADEPKLGFSIGVHSTSIEGSSSNGGVGGGYLGGQLGAVVRTGRVRAELGIVFSGLRDDHSAGTQFATGLVASSFFSF